MTASTTTGWSEDFSYDYLRRVYEALGDRFKLHRLGEAQEVLESKSVAAFIRHDVDVSLDRAVRLAETEAEWGVRTTFHVMLDSPFYYLRDPRQLERVRAISALGHEIGLHYDSAAKGTTTNAVLRDVAELEGILAAPVRSMSFHRPMPELLRGPTLVGGRISGYAAPLMESYLSDSAGRWREGEPVTSVGQIRSSVAQVLVHPEWWGVDHLGGPDRLVNLAADLSQELEKPYDDISRMLADHIGVAPRTPRVVD